MSDEAQSAHRPLVATRAKLEAAEAANMANEHAYCDAIARAEVAEARIAELEATIQHELEQTEIVLGSYVKENGQLYDRADAAEATLKLETGYRRVAMDRAVAAEARIAELDARLMADDALVNKQATRIAELEVRIEALMHERKAAPAQLPRLFKPCETCRATGSDPVRGACKVCGGSGIVTGDFNPEEKHE